MSDRFREAFKEEASELLGELESALLELEEKPDDRELVDRVFRAMHTIKGSGAMFGFDAISSFTHEVETVFDLVRKGAIAVTKDLIDNTLQARDCIRNMLEASGNVEADAMGSKALLSRFRAMLPAGTGEGKAAAARTSDAYPEAGAAARPVTYRIRFKPASDVFHHGTNPVLLLGELARLGDCRILAHMDAVPSLEEIEPESCKMYWDVILTTDKGLNAIKDVFIFVENDSVISVDPLSTPLSGAETEADLKKLGEIFLERGDITAKDLEEALASKKRVGEILVEKGLVSKDEVRSALAEQVHMKEVQEKQRTEESSMSIRVRAEKLDALMDLVGELVTLQARLGQTSQARADAELTLIAEQADRLVSSLRDTAMSLRMLPIATSFARFRRVMRDLSRDMGKEVDLVTEGGETELDKTVIERLNDPLVHLIRNSVDHGIEPAGIREKAGKPRRGSVRLSASHSGSHVLIHIADDGAGLDKEAIRAEGVARGLIAADGEYSDRAIFDLVFLPGFTTAKTVTAVSGRGVGMDVVRRSIDSLGGSVELNSVRGAGTAVTLKIPLTLAIIEGLLVRIGDRHFVLPLQAVEECVELTRKERDLAEKTRGGDMADVRGRIVPYIRLRDWFSIEGEAPEIEQIAIVSTDSDRVGFVVDSVIGQHQTVIKILAGVFKNIPGISGATILGDGTVALVVDVFSIVSQAERERNAK